METEIKNEIKEIVRREVLRILTNDFVSKKEAARIMGISERIIHRKINSGLVKTVNRKVSKSEILSCFYGRGAV